jgi:penicillin amidase
MTGTYPAPWTPVDSLVIQGVLTQELDYTTGSLDYAILEHSLGAARTMASSAPVGSATVTDAQTPNTAAPVRSDDDKAVSDTAARLLAQLSQLPACSIHQYPDSDAWAANGSAVTGGKQSAVLGGDPHLPQTLPSVWYEVALSAPGYQVSGVSVPGLPGILLGHNSHIAWSLTDTQNEATLYYSERLRGNSYYWNGSWHPLTQVHYTIPVRGAATVSLTVDITVHGRS